MSKPLYRPGSNLDHIAALRALAEDGQDLDPYVHGSLLILLEAYDQMAARWGYVNVRARKTHVHANSNVTFNVTVASRNRDSFEKIVDRNIEADQCQRETGIDPDYQR